MNGPLLRVALSATLSVLAASDARVARAADETGLTLLDVVRATIRGNPDVRLAARRTEGRAGDLLAAGVAFDPQVEVLGAYDRVRSTVGDADSYDRRWTYGLRVQKQMRFGATLSPEVDVVRTHPSVLGLSPVAEATARLQLVVPLARDRGGELSRAPLRAAEYGLQAGVFEQQHEVSRRVCNAAVAYWEYLAAQRRAAVRRSAEDRAERMVAETRVLVEADERTRTDLIQVEANRAAKRVDRINAEQGVVAARHALGQLLGLEGPAIAELPAASAEFPPPSAESLDEERAILDLAIARRADLAAAARERRASEVDVEAARHGLRSGIDLVATAGYRGLDGGRGVLTPFYRNVRGMEASFQLRYQRSAQSGARGRLMQATATHEQRRIVEDAVRREIASELHAARETLSLRQATLRGAQEAVRLFTSMVEAEQRKFQLGASTLFDAIQAHDELTNALLAELASQQGYATAIASYEFQTGRLAEAHADPMVMADRLAAPQRQPAPKEER